MGDGNKDGGSDENEHRDSDGSEGEDESENEDANKGPDCVQTNGPPSYSTDDRFPKSNKRSSQTSCDALCWCLSPDMAIPLQELESWLHGQLLVKNGVSWVWCKHWTNRITDSKTLQEQLIIRCLSCPTFPGFDITVSIGRHGKMRAFTAYTSDKDELRLTKSYEPTSSFMKMISARKYSCFLGTLKDPELTQHTLNMISSNELRGRGNPVLYDLYWDRDSPNSKTVEILKLTNWQQQTLFIQGADSTDVLTDVQSCAYGKFTSLLMKPTIPVIALSPLREPQCTPST
ncbi:hypothetical protein HD806DRAFT_540743 [Xylariaceae sp. AK1471]|nr:hypothetical protein HD806DRAFT_540743 [Xylariaceae sp. AK1471]